MARVLVRTASVYQQSMFLSKNKKNITIIYLKIVIFTAVKYHSILACLRNASTLNDTSNVTDSVFAIFQNESNFSPLVQNSMIQILM